MIEDCKPTENFQAGVQFAEGQDAKELLGAILGIQTELQYGAVTPENAVERMRRALRVMPQPVTHREGAQAVVVNAPEHIVLVVGDIADNTSFGDLHEVTWCAGRQHDADVEYVRADLTRAIRAQPHAPQPPEQSAFQARVQPWMLACFGAEIAANSQERNYRFLEEALELVQACGATQSEAHQLVDYVYGRPVGERAQEVGGVMVTLAALCLAQGLDMHEAGETELARIWTKVEQIRAKRAAKPMSSPLPQHVGTVHDERAAVEYYNQNPSAALFDMKRRFAGPHSSAEAVANDSRAMGENWSVRVEQDGRTILTISDQHLSGEEGADENLIVGAARHLLAFVGYGLPPSNFDPDSRELVTAEQPCIEGHPDDAAVNRFAAAMKAKMAASRVKGRRGWDDPERCPASFLAAALIGHIPKGDPVDVGNFAMMLFNRADSLGALPTAWRELLEEEVSAESLTQARALLASEQPSTAAVIDGQVLLAKSVFGGLNSLRWLLNITTEFDRKDVRTRQAARLLDEYQDKHGRTNRALLETLWKALHDKLSLDDTLECLAASPGQHSNENRDAERWRSIEPRLHVVTEDCDQGDSVPSVVVSLIGIQPDMDMVVGKHETPAAWVDAVIAKGKRN
ncbi:MAG: hypothetical protein ACN6OP_03465 [Pseudomonadales bacterium]